MKLYHMDMDRVARSYIALATHYEISCVRLPQIKTAVEGKRILFLGKYRDEWDKDVEKGLLKFAALYRETRRTIVDAVSHNFAPIVGQRGVADYFDERFSKWLSYRKENPKTTLHTFFDEQFDRLVREQLFGHSRFAEKSKNPKQPDVSMALEVFLSLFGVTDIVETPDGVCWQVNGHFEVKPSNFGPAAFAWNAFLYNAPGVSLDKKFGQICRAFFPKAKNTAQLPRSFVLNLIERVYAALAIDLAYLRSPFEQPGGFPLKEAEETAATLRSFMLNRLLPMLNGAELPLQS